MSTRTASPPAAPRDETRRVLIRASAGTGKTYQLTRHYLRLLHAGVPAETILATTFTRKAAGEILQRIIGDLARRASGTEVHGIDFSPQEAARHLVTLLRHLHRLQIGTLDSYFAQLAGSHALELGLPPGWKIVEDLDDVALRRQAVAALLAAGGAEEMRELMHLLTKGESKRGIGDLITETVNSLYELYQDTDEASWKSLQHLKTLDEVELAARLEDLREVELPKHATWAKTRDKDYQAALTGQWEAFVGNGIPKKIAAGESSYCRKPIESQVVNAYQPLIDHAKAEILNRVAAQNESAYKLLDDFHKYYQALKRQQAALRFEDLTRRLADRADLPSDAGKSETDQYAADSLRAFRMDGRVEHLLLDEFQDTSSPQWRAVRPLAGLEGGSFLCVGDVKQAIYGWRGGVAEIFDSVATHVPQLKEAELSESRRSSRAVIETVNRVCESIGSYTNLGRAAAAAKDWGHKFTSHTTALADRLGYAQLICAGSAEPEDDASAAAGDDEALAVGTPTLLAAAELAAKVAAEAPAATIGILVRKNATVAEMIYELRQRGLDASGEGGNPLTDALGVRLLLSLVRLADHPSDTAARFHLATSPLAAACGLADAFDSSEAAGAAARELSRHVRGQLVEEGYGKTLTHWAQPLLSQLSRRERDRLQQFLALAHRYNDRSTLRGDDFLRYVETTKVADPNTSRLRVMTIHQAKGLEFDCVILPELTGGFVGQNDLFVVERPDPAGPVTRVCRYQGEATRNLLPEPIRKMHEEAARRQATESFCVLYVALTRAARALYMIVPPASSTEKQLPQSAAGLLRFALADGKPADPGTLLYEQGDPCWYRQLPAAAPSSAASDAAEWMIQLAPASASPHRGLPRTAPSHLEGDRLIDLGQKLASGTRRVLRRGEALHAFFSKITWLDEPLPDDAELLAVLPADLAAPEQLQAWLTEFRRLLAAPTVSRVLHRDSFAELLNTAHGSALDWEVQNERAILVRLDGQLLSGTIDRLVLARRGGEVVAAAILDYKSDDVTAGDERTLCKRDENYAPQIRAYRRAVEQLYHLSPERIRSWLLYTQADALREINPADLAGQ